MIPTCYLNVPLDSTPPPPPPQPPPQPPPRPPPHPTTIATTTMGNNNPNTSSTCYSSQPPLNPSCTSTTSPFRSPTSKPPRQPKSYQQQGQQRQQVAKSSKQTASPFSSSLSSLSPPPKKLPEPTKPKTTTLEFRVRHNVAYGRRIYIVGNTPSMGYWDTSRAVRMKWSTGDIWRCTTTINHDDIIPNGRNKNIMIIEYKYGIVNDGDEKNNWEWEAGENHVIRISCNTSRSDDRKKKENDAMDVWGGGGGLEGKGGSGIRGCGSSQKIINWKRMNGDGIGGGEPPPTPEIGVGTKAEELLVKNALEKLEQSSTVGLLHAVDSEDETCKYMNGLCLPSTSMTKVKGKRLVFRIKYQTTYGEHVYVVGSIPELGSWNKERALKLNYQKNAPTPGLWELVVVIPRDKQHVQFEYKYFVKLADGARRWEIRNNRVARPFLGSQHVGAQQDAAHHSINEKEDDPDHDLNGDHNECGACDDDIEALLLDDRWDKIRIEFSIFFPTEHGEGMYITGDPPELGAWFRPGPIPMHLGERQKLETDVEGQKWIKAVYVDPSVVSFNYRYIVINPRTKKEIWEREPNRCAQFEGKIPYNSVFVCRDVNFVGGMDFDRVPPNMFIGPYPQTEEDIDKIHEAGATAIFNVQTDQDFRHRGIQWHALMTRYRALGIEVHRYPITDFDATSLQSRLLGAVKALNDITSRGKDVYIHCTAGMGRAPAVAVAYLCWVKKWDLDDAVAHVKKFRKVAVPNVRVLRRALAEYQFDGDAAK